MDRFDVIEQEQLAAQIVAVMDAHFRRPTAAQKRHILKLAAEQVKAAESVATQPLEADAIDVPQSQSGSQLRPLALVRSAR